MIRQGMLTGHRPRQRRSSNYIKALNKGILKVMSKMGISTLAELLRRADLRGDRPAARRSSTSYFTHTTSRVGGVGIDVIAEGSARCGTSARSARQPARPSTSSSAGGEYQWRRDGEYHLFNPETVFKLQHATRSGQYAIFKEYTRAVDRQNEHRATLRGLFRLKPAGPPVPIDEVEPVETIVKRFATGAMSYGSISGEAHETLAIAMNRLGGKSNTGEGGEDAGALRARSPTATRSGSAIKQVALGPLRRHQRVPRQRRRPADQDGAGRQARRGRPAARAQGVPVDREGAALDARRRPDLAAAAPRHLFDRGPGAADLRPEELEPARAHLA